MVEYSGFRISSSLFHFHPPLPDISSRRTAATGTDNIASIRADLHITLQIPVPSRRSRIRALPTRLGLLTRHSGGGYRGGVFRSVGSALEIVGEACKIELARGKVETFFEGGDGKRRCRESGGEGEGGQQETQGELHFGW